MYYIYFSHLAFSQLLLFKVIHFSLFFIFRMAFPPPSTPTFTDSYRCLYCGGSILASTSTLGKGQTVPRILCAAVYKRMSYSVVSSCFELLELPDS